MTRRLVVERLRKRLTARGYVPATTVPPAVEGRPDDYTLVESKLVEGSTLRTHAVGPAAPLAEPLAFLDGVQRVEVIGFAGVGPIVVAEIAAAVRRRESGEFRTVERDARRLVIAAEEVLESSRDDLLGFDPCPLDLAERSLEHPLKALERARQVVDRERGRLEREVGERYRREFPTGWVVVDGVLTDSGLWERDERAIGVSKSHATLPFAGAELLTYLRLAAGERTSVFEPATWRMSPAYSWGLRLWPWEGQDLLHGLVRVEVAATDGSIARADEISRWLLAERVPLSRPDPRWDRQLYGIATVERHLRAQG
ncbi:MAG: hypothetical protein R2909_06445 [Gemmatimonadales bacterium]